MEQAPDPKDIAAIVDGRSPGNQPAAREAFRQLGEVVGDALASALTLIDGLAVIGGGLSGAWPHFLPAVVAELNGTYLSPEGKSFHRLASAAFNLEDPAQPERFLRGETRAIHIPGTSRIAVHDSFPRIGVGITRLGTSQAIATGAHAFAIRKLDGR